MSAPGETRHTVTPSRRGPIVLAWQGTGGIGVSTVAWVRSLDGQGVKFVRIRPVRTEPSIQLGHLSVPRLRLSIRLERTSTDREGWCPSR